MIDARLLQQLDPDYYAAYLAEGSVQSLGPFSAYWGQRRSQADNQLESSEPTEKRWVMGDWVV
jgi:hypothetical protein